MEAVTPPRRGAHSEHAASQLPPSPAVCCDACGRTSPSGRLVVGESDSPSARPSAVTASYAASVGRRRRRFRACGVMVWPRLSPTW